jgi:hypothetical protein
VEVVGLGGRIVGVAADAAAAAAAAGVGRKSGTRRCQRCYDDTAVVGVIGYGEIVRKHQETELTAREIGDDEEGDAGVGEVEVNWPWDLRAPQWNPWRVERNPCAPCGKIQGGNEGRTCYLDRIEIGEEGTVRMVEGTEDENPLVWFEVYRTKPGRRPLRWIEIIFGKDILEKRWDRWEDERYRGRGRREFVGKSKTSILST